ncbi:SNF2 family DNA-dependent ATPase [Phlebopus sp. FC_14]|nr:SNF2 family DNA-dependent ATPase [Phlebopus sp. FC_14]
MSVSPPSSPTQFEMSPVPATSTAASSPPATTSSRDEVEVATRESTEPSDAAEDEQFRERFARLELLLEKSFTYSNLLGAQMDKEKRTSALRAAMRAAGPADFTARKRPPPSRRAQRKLKREEGGDSMPGKTPEDGQRESEPHRDDDNAGGTGTGAGTGTEARPKFPQPSLVTGGTLKDYQLDGVEWMVSLDKNGVSGILADEMGLGKTLQVIAFNAHLRELGHFRPFLIVCPLSVIHNWIEEFHRFAPTIPVCMYHGSPAERAKLRRTVMREPDEGVERHGEDEHEFVVKKAARKGRGKKGKRNLAPAKTNCRPAKKRKVDSDDDDNDDVYPSDDDASTSIPTSRNITSKAATPPQHLPAQTQSTFPVVVTTYEIIIRDRAQLAKYNWGYIVVDEGHRLKNLNCRLIQEIKKYPSAGRMILTGTPLHNNLAELWSLLNFILPDIFDDLDTFQEWFNLGTLQSRLSPSQSSHLISTLHGILKPFLLRRLKADVLGKTLPPKKEYVIYAPLSILQRQMYEDVVEGRIRGFLMARGEEAVGKGNSVSAMFGGKKMEVDVDAPRKLRAGKRRRYDVDGSDDDGEPAVHKQEQGEEDVAELGRQHRMRENLKGINNMRLQNTVMQLRKVCSHPLLFRDPAEEIPETTKELVDASGKMMLLERLLDELFRRKHKVLLFSQFTTMLDIIETWATELKNWPLCRIDGSTGPLERRDEMTRFQEGGDRGEAPVLFLLSTRAGGLGINLTAADTVIFYDQDWNPQMDIQAQDRAHRIGQTKPVLIFRLVTAHTVETRIMHRATEKRKLEALVIAKGKFKLPGQANNRTKADAISEMAAELLKLEGEHIEVVPETGEAKRGVLRDEDLEEMLDRREAVFTDRGKGWSRGGRRRDEGKGEGAGEEGTGTTFAVYEAPVHHGNEVVARLMGEQE